MAGFTEGPQVGLKVAAAPTSQALRTRTSDTEIDTFVRGLGSLNSALQDNFNFERRQDLEAGRNAGQIGSQPEETPSRSFHEGWLRGSGEAAGIRDASELQAKIATEAPADPAKAAEITKQFYAEKTNGLTQPHFKEGYDSVLAKESMRVQAQAGENNAKEIVSQNDSNAFTRIQYVLDRAGPDHKLTWDKINQVAGDHALTGSRKDQLVLTALEGAAAAGNMDALAVLKAARIDAKTGNSFPALADNPAYTAKVQELYTKADAAQLKNLREEVDQKLFPELRAADKGLLDVNAFLAWAQDPKYSRVVSASLLNTVINSNEAALARKQNESDKLGYLAAHEAAKDEVVTAATAALAAGNGTMITSVEIPSKTGNGSTTITKKELQETAFEGWVKANNPTPDQILHMASRTIGDDGKVFDYKPLTNQFRLLSSSGLRSAVYVRDPKTGESVAPPAGPLPPEVEQQLATFNSLNANYAPVLKQMIGEDTYKHLDYTNTFKKLGMDGTTSAALAHNIAVADKTPGDRKEFAKALKASEADTIRTHMLSWLPGGAFRDDVNVNAVQSRVTEVAYGLQKSGFFPEANAAVSEAVRLLSPQMFPANNAVYFKSDFPPIPAVFSNDPQAGVMLVLEDALKRTNDKTLSAGDMRLQKLPSGKFIVQNKDGTGITGSDGTYIEYDVGSIGRLWSNADTASIQRLMSDRAKAEARIKERPSSSTKTTGSKRRGSLAMEAADRAAQNQ